MTSPRARTLVCLLSIPLFSFLLGSASPGTVEEGLASWYGGKFQGRTTASGEIFDTNQFTAAHKTLPFGTIVRVTNVENGLSTVVRINDRGPFVAGRIIDLSRAAAVAIGMAGAGVARVTVLVVPPDEGGAQVRPPRYTIQLGAFRTHSYAETMAREAAGRGFAPELERTGDGIHRVVIRGVQERDLEEMRRKLAAAGWKHTLARLER